MTRRAMLAAVGLAPLAGRVKETRRSVKETPRSLKETFFGLLTIEGYELHRRRTGIGLRVLVDGVDVTDRCYEANDREGYADCYKLNEAGLAYVEIGVSLWLAPARERLTGTVRFVAP